LFSLFSFSSDSFCSDSFSDIARFTRSLTHRKYFQRCDKSQAFLTNISECFWQRCQLVMLHRQLGFRRPEQEEEEANGLVRSPTSVNLLLFHLLRLLPKRGSRRECTRGLKWKKGRKRWRREVEVHSLQQVGIKWGMPSFRPKMGYPAYLFVKSLIK
jgi:hypothetical protein